MKIFIGADHRGFRTKEMIRKFLIENNHDVQDMGAYELVPEDDYVDYAKAVGNAVSASEKESQKALGIIVCGSGVGIDIAANKISGIRSGLGFAPEQIHSARNDDNINVLSIPNDYLSDTTIKAIIISFISTEFHPIERYTRRINKIKELEKK